MRGRELVVLGLGGGGIAAIVPASVWHSLAHSAIFEDESAELAMKKVSFRCYHNNPDLCVLSFFPF